METLLFFKAFLIVIEITFELWKRQTKKASDAEIIKRLEVIENQVKKLNS